MPPSRARRNQQQRALISRRLLQDIVFDIGYEIRGPGMRLSRQAREMLQAEGERYMLRLLQRLAVMAMYSGNTTVLLHHLRALQALDRVQDLFDTTRD